MSWVDGIKKVTNQAVETGTETSAPAATTTVASDRARSGSPATRSASTSEPAAGDSATVSDTPPAPPEKPPQPYGEQYGTADVTVDEWPDGKNDHLIGILQNQGFTEEQIYAKDKDGKTLLDRVAEQNQLDDPNLIHPGQQLVVPTPDPPPPPPEEPAPAEEPPAPGEQPQGPQAKEVKNVEDATRVLGENFDALDDVFNGELTSEDTDGRIGARDLTAVANGDPEVLANLEKRIRAQAAQEGVPTDELDAEVERRVAEARSAAQYLTDPENKDELDNLDVGGDRGLFERHDGKISRGDIDKVHAQAVKDREAKELYAGRAENLDQASQILDENFDVLDDVFHDELTSDDTDGRIGTRDLQAVAEGDPEVLAHVETRLRAQAAQEGVPTSEIDAYVKERLADVRAAAAYLTSDGREGELKDLDVGGDEGLFENADGKISREDIKNIRENVAEEKARNRTLDRAQSAARVFQANADALDDVFNPNLTSEDTDGKIGMRDLEAVASGDPQVLQNLETRVRAQGAQNGIPTDQLDRYVREQVQAIRQAAAYVVSDEGAGARLLLDTGVGQNDNFPDGRFSVQDFEAVLAATPEQVKDYLS